MSLLFVLAAIFMLIILVGPPDIEYVEHLPEPKKFSAVRGIQRFEGVDRDEYAASVNRVLVRNPSDNAFGVNLRPITATWFTP
jgi:hypothetical protein